MQFDIIQTQTAMAHSTTLTAVAASSSAICSFEVFQNGELRNGFLPKVWMGDIASIDLDENYQFDYERRNVIRIAYSPRGDQGWAGISWQTPEDNWDNNISCATKLTFWARGEEGQEVAEFKMEDVRGDYSYSTSIGKIVLSREWEQFEIDLRGINLARVVGGFVWVTSDHWNPYGAVIYLDDIKFEGSQDIRATQASISLAKTATSIEQSLAAMALTQKSITTETPPIPSFTPSLFPVSPAVNITLTPSPALTLQAAFEEIDNQFKEYFKGNIAFNKPEQMKKNDAATIELILSPSLSESDLVTQIVERGDFITSTADPNVTGTLEPSVLIAPSGEIVTVQTSQIEITNYLKAELKSRDPEALTVTDMLSAEQLVSSVKPTTWRWSVTAKKEGKHTLELIISQLIKQGDKETWHEVETYKADITVEVTPKEWFKSWWAAIIGAITAIAAIIISFQSIWKWFEERTKKPSVMQDKIIDGDEKDKPKKSKGKKEK